MGCCCIIPLFFGIAYLPYYVCREWLTILARNQTVTRPAGLFFCGLACIVIQIFLLFLVWGLNTSDYDGRESAVFFFVLASLAGFILFIVSLANSATIPRRVRLKRLETLAVTKFQIWLQDIFVATFVSGACLSVIFNIWPRAGMEVLVYELFNILGSFVLVMEVLRFQPLAKSPKHRAAFVAALMVLAAIPGIWALETMAWLAASYALTAFESQ